MGCPVCLSDFEADQEVVKTGCGYTFCKGCLEPWLKEDNRCPVCRTEFGIQPARSSCCATGVPAGAQTQAPQEDRAQDFRSEPRRRGSSAGGIDALEGDGWMSDVSSLSVAQLKTLMRRHRVSAHGCIEKRDLVMRLCQ